MRAGTVPILCYHAVSPDVGGPLAPWVTAPEVFTDHLDALADAGYQPTALHDLVAQVHDRGEPVPERAIVLTVDDGYADVADEIWPRLAERAWPATLYVSTGLIGGRYHERPMLDVGRLVELAAAGLALGAHGHHHLALDTVAPPVAEREIRRSREWLEDWTGSAVTSFAYPHGFHDRGVRQQVIDAGFTSACAVRQRLSSAADDRFALARIMPEGTVTAEQLLARLHHPRTPVARGEREPLRTTAHRRVRRLRARVAA